MPSRAAAVSRHPAVLAVGWGLLVGLVATHVDHYWIPLDDGTLAQSAERVLNGELPHRDFGDPYTGLNAAVGALAFRLWGVSLFSLRIPLVIGFAFWLPAVWLLARRFTGDASAGLISLMVGLTSVLAYPAAMPTWFGLFAVTWGLAFLLHGMETGSRTWLAAAGFSAGVSVLFKVTGLYFLAAILLTLAWRRGGGPTYAGVVWTGLLLFLYLLARLVLPDTGLSGTFHFFLPAAALSAALAVRVWPDAGSSREALRELAKDVGVVMAGCAAPILLFLVPYAASGSVGTWFEGVFLLPARRFGYASSPPGRVWTVVPPLVAVAVAWWGSHRTAAGRRWIAWGAAAALTVALAVDDIVDGAVLESLWYVMRGWIPALSLWAAWVILVRRERPLPTRRRLPREAFAVVLTAALWALVQFPWASPAYLFYVAPLGILGTVATVRLTGGEGRPFLGMVALLWLFLAGGYVVGTLRSAPATLPGSRAGIHVSHADSMLYTGLMALLRSRPEGLWATPDAPEVYFLSGRSNPTPVLYEFLQPDGVGANVAEAGLQGPPPGTRTVVLNRRPLFSDVPSAAFESTLRERFPMADSVGPFLVISR